MFPVRLYLPRINLIIIPTTTTTTRLFSTSSPIILSKASKTRISKGKKSSSSILNSSIIKETLRGTGVGASYELYGKDEKVLGREEKVEVEKKVEEEEFKIEDGKIVKSTDEPLMEPSISTKPTKSISSSPPKSPSTTSSTSSTPSPPTEPLPKVTLYEYSDIVEANPQEIPSIDARMLQLNLARYPHHAQEEETIYTANPPFKVPLMLTAAFVFSVFALNAADTVRVGLSTYNEETGVNELAKPWKRYSLAGLFLGIGIAAFSWAVLAPARIVTRLTLRRPLNSPTNHFAYPKDSLISLHTPITKLPFLSSRIVKLSEIHLLGPISDSPKPYHPEEYVAPESPKKSGKIATHLSYLRHKYFISSAPKKPLVPWGTGTKKTSHSPIIIKGDRASYSLAVRRGNNGIMDDETGAWAKDWDMLERSLLGLEHEGDIVKSSVVQKKQK